MSIFLFLPLIPAAESQKNIKICDKLRQFCRYAFTSGAEIRKIKVPVETPERHTASEILKLQMKWFLKISKSRLAFTSQPWENCISQLFISIFKFLSQIYRGYLQVLSNCIALIVRNGGGSSVTFEIETQCATFKGWKLDPHVAHSCPKCFGGLGKLWIVRKFRFLCFEVQVCLYDC